MHLEWGFKDGQVWLLQLDFEGEDKVGEDPKLLLNENRPKFAFEEKLYLEFFKFFQPGARTRWFKLKNISDFCVDDEPPKHRMFFSPGASIERVIGDRKALRRLEREIHRVTGGFAVIRTDTTIKREPQHNLPRTDTIDAKNGAKWLRERCKELKRAGVAPNDFCFIMHRYIPGVASAWAFCEAGGDVVQIDSLWGLPDGLQFCPHDSFEVDLRIGKVPSKRIRFKPYFIREQLDGSWEYVRVNRKFGRHSSLSDKALIYIAKQTRKISDKIDHNAQIMWFCNIPSSEGLGSHIPWYRTTHFGSRQQQHKRYGRSYDIRSREDLDALATEDHRGLCLRIFPEVSLLRGEDFLDNVIAVARQYDLPVPSLPTSLRHRPPLELL